MCWGMRINILAEFKPASSSLNQIVVTISVVPIACGVLFGFILWPGALVQGLLVMEYLSHWHITGRLPQCS